MRAPAPTVAAELRRERADAAARRRAARSSPRRTSRRRFPRDGFLEALHARPRRRDRRARHPPGARLRGAAGVHRPGRSPTSTSGRSTRLPRGAVRDRHLPRGPEAGRGLAAHGVRPQQRLARASRRASRSSPTAAPTSAARCSRTARPAGRAVRRYEDRRADPPCSRPASAARATAASTTPRATARPGRRCARSTARVLDQERQPRPRRPVQRRHRRGHGKTRDPRSTTTRTPGVHVDGLERASTRSRPPQLMADTSARRAQHRERSSCYPLDWLEERSGLVGGIKYFLFRKVPHDTNWLQTLGSATLTAFLVQAITGVDPRDVLQARPGRGLRVDPAHHERRHARLARPRHAPWGASVFIILMFFHMARVFLFGAYKYPRELNWIIGVLLLMLGMLEGFTGYLLPWDQTAYWATVVGINLNGTAPFLGPVPRAVPARGRRDRRGHAARVLLDPHAARARARSSALIALHLYLVIRLGVTLAALVEAAAAGRDARAREPGGARRPRPAGGARERGGELMASRGLDERRAQQQALQGGRRARGKPFFPYAMFHDTVMSLVVVCVIIGLACVWYFTAGEEPRATSAGSARATPTRPTRARRASSRGRTGTSTSSSTCSASSSGRRRSCSARSASRRSALMLLLALPFIDLRRERRLSAPAGRDRRRDPDRGLDGRAHVQGRDRQGIARRPRTSLAGAGVGREAGLRRRRAGVRGREALRAGRLSRTATPTSARASRTPARPTSPTSAPRRARTRTTSSATSPTRPSSATSHARVPESRRREPEGDRRLPRRVQGRK